MDNLRGGGGYSPSTSECAEALLLKENIRMENLMSVSLMPEMQNVQNNLVSTCHEGNSRFQNRLGCMPLDSLLCRPTLAGLGPPRTVCLLSLAIRLPIIFH